MQPYGKRAVFGKNSFPFSPPFFSLGEAEVYFLDWHGEWQDFLTHPILRHTKGLSTHINILYIYTHIHASLIWQRNNFEWSGMIPAWFEWSGMITTWVEWSAMIPSELRMCSKSHLNGPRSKETWSLVNCDSIAPLWSLWVYWSGCESPVNLPCKICILNPW